MTGEPLQLAVTMRAALASGAPDGWELAHTDDLKALLEYLDIEHAFIVGLSMGGGFAVTTRTASARGLASAVTVATSGTMGVNSGDCAVDAASPLST